MTTLEVMQRAKAASTSLARASSGQKDDALLAMAEAIVGHMGGILEANGRDVKASEGVLSDAMLDRLRLTESRINAMADGIRQVVGLPDPVGRVIERTERPNGLIIEKRSVPMGVVAIIFESRPNVSSDAASLALKSGNACILRGGKESFGSTDAIVAAMQKGLKEAGFPGDAVLLVQDTTRQSATELMRGVGYVDVLIPRGGAGLINACIEGAKVPCIQTGTGICHIFVDAAADQEMACKVVENAKASRPSVCNAAEVCLVHGAIAAEFLPKLKDRLVKGRLMDGLRPVELRLDEKAGSIISGVPAGPDDFDTEFLDYILAVKVVAGLDEAIAHIAEHSTGHSEAIVTEDKDAAERFTTAVDSTSVYVNASTRFTDGGEFGLGCEMGISTQKLHARGPIGLKELTTYKYVIHGNGQIR